MGLKAKTNLSRPSKACSQAGYRNRDRKACACFECFSGPECQYTHCTNGAQRNTDVSQIHERPCICTHYFHKGACCEDKVCINGAKPGTDGRCNCTSDIYFGDYCEKVSCLNNGHFIPEDGWCACGEHFQGRRCEEKICRHGGTFSGLQGFGNGTCLCKPRYSGPFCEEMDCSPGRTRLRHTKKGADWFYEKECVCGIIYTGPFCGNTNWNGIAALMAVVSFFLAAVALGIYLCKRMSCCCFSQRCCNARSDKKIPPTVIRAKQPAELAGGAIGDASVILGIHEGNSEGHAGTMVYYGDNNHGSSWSRLRRQQATLLEPMAAVVYSGPMKKKDDPIQDQDLLAPSSDAQSAPPPYDPIT